MTESEFFALAESTLNAIEAALERAETDFDLDVECSRNGNVLEIELIENGSKIIVNSQALMQEIWVAAKAGGFHYRREGEFWRDTRNDRELFSDLSDMVSGQAGCKVNLTS